MLTISAKHHAYLFNKKGRLSWSGYHASGDTRHAPHEIVVSVGRAFIITSDDHPKLYLLGVGPQQFAEFSPSTLARMARLGWFGFSVISDRKRPTSLAAAEPELSEQSQMNLF
jgi:hypothetical protein